MGVVDPGARDTAWPATCRRTTEAATGTTRSIAVAAPLEPEVAARGTVDVMVGAAKVLRLTTPPGSGIVINTPAYPPFAPTILE